ncbi:MAG: DUF2802 domain-containing protein [Gammaproteobacteria bacterium]|nr:DUF2802 domain-containing protein [Gammaproteobacteria bacterium]
MLYEFNPILLGLAAVAILALSNMAITAIFLKRLAEEKMKNAEIYKRMNELSWDVKGLYDSSKGVGKRLQLIERRMSKLEEAQDQLTLKDPSYQTYQHAIRMIRDGATVESVSETSGLSKGEIELLSLLQKIHEDEPLQQTV